MDSSVEAYQWPSLSINEKMQLGGQRNPSDVTTLFTPSENYSSRAGNDTNVCRDGDDSVPNNAQHDSAVTPAPPLFTEHAVSDPSEAGKQNAIDPPTSARGLPNDNARLRALFSQYDKLITKTSLPHVSTAQATQDTGVSDSTTNGLHQTATEALAALERPQSTQPRQSHRKRTMTPRAAASARHVANKKRAAASARQLANKKRASMSHSRAYEFLRLSEARISSTGEIEVKIEWASTWATIDYLQGDLALVEAQELVIKTFGSKVWEGEIQNGGHLGMAGL